MEGLQRVEAEYHLTSMPLRVGDTSSDDEGPAAHDPLACLPWVSSRTCAWKPTATCWWW